MELKKTIEAVLFASGKPLTTEEIARLCKKEEGEVLHVLFQIQKELDEEKRPTVLVDEGDTWKLTLRQHYVPVVRKLVTKTDLAKTVLETLAVVSYKAPVMQSSVIKIRTNKAYDHLRELEEREFITREKKGRSKLIRLTSKFFDYFDIPAEKLRQRFRNIGQIEKKIEEKEREHEVMEEGQRKATEELLAAPEIEVGDKNVEVYDMSEPVDELDLTGVEVYDEKLGELKVFDVERKIGPEHHEHMHIDSPHVKLESETVEEAEPEKVEEAVEEKAEHKVVDKAEETPEEKAEPEKAESEKAALEKLDAAPAEEEPGEVELEKSAEAPQKKRHITLERVYEESKEHAASLETREFEKGKGLYADEMSKEIEEKIEEKVKKLLEGEKEE